jgi:hypothetical protein
MLLHNLHIYINNECSVVLCAAYAVFLTTTYLSMLSVEGYVHIPLVCIKDSYYYTDIQIGHLNELQPLSRSEYILSTDCKLSIMFLS